MSILPVKGGSHVMLAKGNRSKVVTEACNRNGGFYLGSIGGPAARLAKDCITKVEVLEYPELGMEAVWKIEVVDFPAFIVVDDKGHRLLRGRVSAGDALGQGIAPDRRCAPRPISGGVRRRRPTGRAVEERLRRRGERDLRRAVQADRVVGVDFGESPTSDEVDAFVKDTFVPAVRDEVACICSLGLPSADTNRLQGVLFDMEAVLDDLTTNPDEALAAGTTPLDDINRRLDEYGLTACGSGTRGHNVYRRDVTLIQDLPELDTFERGFQADPHGLLREALARGPLARGSFGHRDAEL